MISVDQLQKYQCRVGDKWIDVCMDQFEEGNHHRKIDNANGQIMHEGVVTDRPRFQADGIFISSRPAKTDG